MQAKGKLLYLSKNEFFAGVPREELHAMASAFTMTTCDRGHIFYMPGEKGQALFLLKAGRVQLYRLSPAGKRLVIEVLEPGTIFGELALIGQGLENAFAESLDPCVLCVMSRRDVEQLLARHPQLMRQLLEIVGRRLLDAETRLTETSCLEISGRIAAALLRLEDKYGREIVGYSHQDLAELIGTHRETVTVVLNHFKQCRLIAVERKQIVIRDHEGLCALAAENPSLDGDGKAKSALSPHHSTPRASHA